MIEILTGENKKTKFAKLDPRIRILWLFTMSFLAMFWSSFIPLFIIVLTLIPVWIYSGGLKKALIISLKIFPYLIFLFIFQLLIKFVFAGMSDPYLFRFWKMDISKQEIHKAFIESVRFFIMLRSAQVFFKTIDFGELTAGIRQSFPDINKKVKNLKEGMAFLLGTAYQSIPLLDKEIKQIVEVQKARGIEIKKGNKIQQVKKLVRMGMPIFIRSLDLIKDSGLALLNFGFDLSLERSSYKQLKLQKMDLLIAGSLVFALICAGIIKIFIPGL